MKRDKIALLAKALKVSPFELILDDCSNESHNSYTIYNQLAKIRKEKIYSFAEYQLKKQIKIAILEEKTERLTGIPNSCYISEDNLKEIPKYTNFTITVEGDGMVPIFNDGDVVFVQKSKIFENGSIVVISFIGRTEVKVSFSIIKS